jgi:hypothetical protein
MKGLKEIKQFSGILNTDDSNETIASVHHKFAMNGRFRNGRFEGVLGNTLKTNTFLPATGTNENIGAFFDDLKQKIYFFNYNSNALHGIYQYDIITDTFSRIVLNGYNTDGDVLNFSLDGFIYAVKILYGDDVQGDTLFFNNSQRELCQINIKTALSGGYGTIKRSFLNVIKAPLSIPALQTYEDDAAITINNLRKKLFKFKLRAVYKDNLKSVWSSQGEMPLPVNYLDTLIDNDPTKNCKIALVIPTGKEDVLKIEIAVSVSNGNGFGDYELCYVIDKARDSISSNDITVFRFLNDKVTTPIDIVDSIQTQDYVPLKALSLEMLNGNVPIYGCITEGYNPITIAATITSSSVPQKTTQNPFIFTANQSGDTGFGTGNIHGILIGSVRVGDVYTIYTTNETLTFTATVATAANVIAGLVAAATTAGFTIVSSDTENLVIVKSGESLQRVLATPILIAVSNSYVYDYNSLYNLCFVYFDGEGRTIGSQVSNNMSFKTGGYTETAGVPNIPKAALSVTSRPPIEAKYFQIGRSKNLTKLRTFYWISDRTFKDDKFAYISIDNLNLYIKNNSSSSFLAYDFSKDDRIRFVKKVEATITVYPDKDFTILSQEINPEINGAIQVGQFLKISIPTISGTFDFGASGFNNYLINLYTPAKLNAEGLDNYYEFGERYTIGDAGLATRYHQGMLQNQTSNLSQPATFDFIKGDCYFRQKTVGVGAEYIYEIQDGVINRRTFTVGCNFISSSLNDVNITTGNSPLQGTTVPDPIFTPSTNTTRKLLEVVAGSYNLRVKGSVSFKFDNFDEDFCFYLLKRNGFITSIVKEFRSPYVPNQYIYEPITKGAVKTFTFDVTVGMGAGERLFILGRSKGGVTQPRTMYNSKITITNDLNYSEYFVCQNFSDFFESAVSSNATAGRTFNVDENAAQVTIPSLLRWGLDYQPNTNINRSNRFRALNQTEADRSYGSIQVMKSRGNSLRLFQDTKCSVTGVYETLIQTGAGNILSKTDEILTKNSFTYYQGDFGIGNQPTSVVHGKSQDYFIDPIRNYQCRIGGSGGVEPISELNKGQFYIQPKFSPYNKAYITPSGAKAKIIGYYDFYEEECVTFLQGGTLGASTIPYYAFSFNEKRNAYSSFFDLQPENIICANDVTYAFKNGQMYIHNNTTNYCNFFGVQYYPSIKLVFNDKEIIKKSYNAIGYQANQKWQSDTLGDVNTSMINPQTNLQQQSLLLDVDYDIEDGLRYANFLRDANSGLNAQLALLEGDELNGNWIEINLKYIGSQQSWLYLPYVSYQPMARNF